MSKTDYNLTPQELKELALHALTVVPKGFFRAEIRHCLSNSLQYEVQIKDGKDRIITYNQDQEEVEAFGEVIWHGLQRSCFDFFELVITPYNTDFRFGGIISNAEDLNRPKQ